MRAEIRPQDSAEFSATVGRASGRVTLRATVGACARRPVMPTSAPGHHEDANVRRFGELLAK